MEKEFIWNLLPQSNEPRPVENDEIFEHLFLPGK